MAKEMDESYAIAHAADDEGHDDDMIVRTTIKNEDR